MTNLKDIPEEVKWRYAAKCWRAPVPLYDSAFRPAVGKKFDEIRAGDPHGDLPIWYLG